MTQPRPSPGRRQRERELADEAAEWEARRARWARQAEPERAPRYGPEARTWRRERLAEASHALWTPASEPPRRGYRDADRGGATWAVGLGPDPRDDVTRPQPRLHRVHRAPKGTNTRAEALREASAQAERELRDLGW